MSSRHVIIPLLLAGLGIPFLKRLFSSPVTLILLLPFFLLFLGIAFLTANIAFGYVLDLIRPAQRNALSTAARPFAFSTPAAWQAVLTRSQWSHKAPQSLPPLYPEAPVVSAAVNDILILIVRDFVLVWYKDISSSPSFPTAVSSTLHASMERLLAKALTLDLSALIVKRVLPKVTAHIEQFRQSEVALRGAGLERKLTQSEELDLLLASRYAARGGGKLHPAVENLSSTFTKQSEENHLRELVEKALPSILPEKEGQSRAVKIVVREIVACAVLYPIMEMLSDPDFWNRQIDQVAGAAIRQQRLISEVRNILEAQIPRPQSQVTDPTHPTTEKITMRTDPKQFESFLRSISRCSSLLDARRLRNDIMGEIRRTRTLLANNANSDWINGEKTEDVVAFLDRLYTAKRKVEKRIVLLGGEADSRQTIYSETQTASPLTLRDILTNPSSLSYFMEFMDRRQRSLLVQFWLTVESFKNPLESVDSDASDDEDEPLLDPGQSATLQEDISLINELYFSSPVPDPVLSAVSQKHITTIRSFGQSAETSTPASERRVRRSVMLAQRQVERQMEQDFEEFQRSELWFRVVADIEANGRTAPADDAPLGSGNASPTSTRHALEHRGRTSSGPAPNHGKPPMTRSESTPAVGVARRIPTPTSPPLTQQPAAPRPAVSNLQVLMSPVADESGSHSTSRAPLFDDPEDAEQQEQSQRMDAIQAALTDIIALDKEHDQAHPGSSSDSLSVQDSLMTASTRLTRDKRRLMFEDEIEEEDESQHEDHEDAEHEKEHGSFQLAGPGDLQLSHEIERLSNKVNKLQTQDAMLDTLIKKAELTGDAQELRLLRKSKSSLTRELRELKFQKTQYEQQESANRLLSDRTRVAIVNSTVGEEDGKQVVRYLVEVQQLAQDGSYASGWVVARRYNEFFNMHNKLRDKYLLVRNLDFPGKRLVTSLSTSFVDNRRVALEKYLQSLIAIPAVCESDELRAFLSRDSPFMAAEPSPAPSKAAASGSAFPGHGLVKTMYQSVAESIDDMFFGPSMLDVIIQRLTTQAAEFVGITGTAIRDEDLVAQALKASGKSSYEDALMHLSGDLKPLEGETSTSTFSSPICDLILAVFELDKKNNWLRRQAIVIILQQVLGGTIERKLRETVKSFLDEPHLMIFINIFRDGLWPGGNLKPSSVPRTVEEKLHTRDEANRKLSALMPDLAANMIGRSNARRGARRIFAVLQNRRLNQHLIYTVVDEIFSALFSEST
ncbi:PhoX domain-containing protein [Lentinus tigrinus ALCF2SS1-7]|uniref:PhoX domain-containing protein n=1 Tax=Lentinus tigrinus ALCF2SS1-7 TaxID=1328758 RepID=UPI001165CA27|nr:PhoX domain-containing protein [Lentinus tigrinus ALCF2SS1-7]